MHSKSISAHIASAGLLTAGRSRALLTLVNKGGGGTLSIRNLSNPYALLYRRAPQESAQQAWRKSENYYEQQYRSNSFARF